MSSFKIRKAKVEDIPALKNLMEQYIVDFYKQPKPNEDSLLQLIEELIHDQRMGLQFVVEENDELLGFSTLYFTFSTLSVKRQACLNDLFVVPKARGKKIGEQLFQTNLAYIREHDFSSMIWETAKDNLVAQSLYNKMGGQLSEWLVYEIR
ncbi:GNAT family N-acetyltransferase [Alkalihalobacillus trypoxylicola]|uniref:GCN5 family acetyltransferase n=1 Tax=Alkalihalobacillus trypoxylicola TaxID=519424 RepID=A0A161P6U1_9BACI|nr:GNAT family N-acetyltransferase [Alkalihalobacillus trypoxylicola]KYG26096.1 GCN5 family acetyltransferase [Alkalihalobacillus trypoxylicola]